MYLLYKWTVISLRFIKKKISSNNKIVIWKKRVPTKLFQESQTNRPWERVQELQKKWI